MPLSFAILSMAAIGSGAAGFGAAEIRGGADGVPRPFPPPLRNRRMVPGIPVRTQATASSRTVDITGTTNSVSIVEVINPPMTARAIGARCSAPSPMANARGSIPKIIATVVMMIGRNLMRPD